MVGDTYAGCPGACESGLYFGAEEVWKPEDGWLAVTDDWCDRCGCITVSYHVWSSISKTCMRGTHGAMTAVTAGSNQSAVLRGMWNVIELGVHSLCVSSAQLKRVAKYPSAYGKDRRSNS